MKYHVRIDGEDVVLDIEERGGRTVVVHPDLLGGEAVVDLTPVRVGGSYSLLVGDTSLPVVTAGGLDELTVIVGSETWHAAVRDEREQLALAAEGAGGGRAGGGILRSVMPGIVREVRVAAGDTVEIGHPLLILEAMKMENEIRADSDGTVSAVHVTPGTAVAKGDPLVTLGACPTAPIGTSTGPGGQPPR